MGRLSGRVGEKTAPGRNGKAEWYRIFYLEGMGRLSGIEYFTWKEWEG